MSESASASSSKSTGREPFAIPYVSRLFNAPVPLGSIMDELPVALVVLDGERRIMLMNRKAEALTGFDRDEARRIPCKYILRSNLCLQHCPVLEAGEKGESVALEGDIIRRDRRKIPVRLTAIPLHDASGKPVGFMETVEDLRPVEAVENNKPQAFSFGEILGRSAEMEELFRILPMIAQTDSALLITGETGTGKDLLAEAVHRASNRAAGPFVKVNCGALPETLMESELFGHTKGAFTGAVADRPGRIRLAHKGSLYLTEIGDLPWALQVKLLTFLDDKTLHPLGSSRSFQADVRVIAATHRDLERMVREGRFREDLLYRLNVVRLSLPPLRERGGDVALLMDHFLYQFASRFGKRIAGYSPEARQRLLCYSYPGNVRELRNIVEFAANICEDQTIKAEHLPSYLVEQRSEASAPEKLGPRISTAALTTASGEGSPQVKWETLERQLILDALVQARGKRSKAARLLGWGRSTLWRKMKQYGINAD
jgi:two-component system response regulator AtoC